MEREQDGQIGVAEVVRDVFDRLPALVIALDGPEQRIVAANAVSRAGRDVVGRTFRDAVPELATEPACAALARAYESGVTHSTRGRDGVDMTAVPRRGDEGRVVGTT